METGIPDPSTWSFPSNPLLDQQRFLCRSYLRTLRTLDPTIRDCVCNLVFTYYCNDLSFTWTIPEMPRNQQTFLCQAFCRQTSTEFVPDALCQVVAEYYRPHDVVNLDDIKSTKRENPPARCVSPIFTICSFRWYLELWPR